MRDGDADVVGALVEFAQGLSDKGSVKAVFEALGDQCTELLRVTGVGVLVVEGAELAVATTNSDVGEKVEGLEVDLGEGPCVDSVRSGKPVFVPDLRDVLSDYPAFGPAALEAGARAIHALPMTGRGEVVGSLNIVDSEPGDLPATALATAQVLSDLAVAYIFAVRINEEQTELAGQLQNALDTRVVIEQAKGVLLERHGESLPEAFDRLRRHARSNSVTVRQVAADVVEGRLRL